MKAAMRFNFTSLVGFLLIVGSFGHNLRGQGDNEIEVLREIRDKVESLNNYIDRLDNSDEPEVQEKTITINERLHAIQDKIEFLKDEILFEEMNDSLSEAKDEKEEKMEAFRARADFLIKRIEEGTVDKDESFEADKVEVVDEASGKESDILDRINAIKDKIEYLKNEIDAGFEREDNFESAEYASSLDKFEEIDNSLSEAKDEKEEKMEAFRARADFLIKRIEEGAQSVDKDESFETNKVEVVDEASGKESDILDRINAIKEKIENLKNKANAGLEEDENFEVDEYALPSGEIHSKDNYANGNGENIYNRINAIKDKIENLKNKANAGLEEDENFEVDEYALPSGEIHSKDKYANDNYENVYNRINAIKDEIEILKNKANAGLEEDENFEVDEYALPSGEIHSKDKYANGNDKKEFEDYKVMEKTNLLKEELRGTIKNTNLEGENDFS